MSLPDRQEAYDRNTERKGACVVRRKLKLRYTKLIKRIELHIQHRLSRTILVQLSAELSQLASESEKANEQILFLTENEQARLAAVQWTETIPQSHAACQALVEEYLLNCQDRATTVPSELNLSAAGYDRQRKTMEAELERLRIQHAQHELQRKQQLLSVMHESERLKERHHELVLKQTLETVSHGNDTQSLDSLSDNLRIEKPMSYPEKVKKWQTASLPATAADDPRSIQRSTRQPDEMNQPDLSFYLPHEKERTSVKSSSSIAPHDRTQYQGSVPPPQCQMQLPRHGRSHPDRAPLAWSSSACINPDDFPHNSSHRVLLARRLPKSDIPKFTGNPLDWPMFSAAFRQSVHKVLDSDADRLGILRELLSDDIRKAMSMYLYDPSHYAEAMRALERRYGNPQRIVQACTMSMAAIPAWKGFYFGSLQHFANELQGITAVLSLGGHHAEIESSSNLMALVKKLPMQMRDDWDGHVVQVIKPRFPNLRDLSQWIDERREAAESVMGESDTSNNRDPSGPRRRNQNPRVFTAFASADCPVCTGGHTLSSCKKFASLPIERRAEIIKERRCCYSCLATGHMSKDCDKGRRCRKDGCNRKHHPLMHDAPRLYPRRTANETADPTSVQQPFSGAVASKGHHRWPCMLPIVPVVLSRADGQQYPTLSLLDKGSEISMLRMDVANFLRLKGPTERRRFTTFHAQDPTYDVRRVSFTATSTDRLFELQIEDSYAVPNLQLTRKHVLDVDEYMLKTRFSYMSDIELPPLAPTEVTLLIGMDQPAAHEVLESRFDPDCLRSPRATLTSFGWCVIGSVPFSERTSAPARCYRLSLADRFEPPRLDELMERFFNIDLHVVKSNVNLAISPDDKCAPLRTVPASSVIVMRSACCGRTITRTYPTIFLLLFSVSQLWNADSWQILVSHQCMHP